MAIVNRICGWCQTPLTPPTITVPDNDPLAGQVTHGICKACKVEYFPTNKDRRILATQADSSRKP